MKITSNHFLSRDVASAYSWFDRPAPVKPPQESLEAKPEVKVIQPGSRGNGSESGADHSLLNRKELRTLEILFGFDSATGESAFNDAGNKANIGLMMDIKA